jgi:hypothetical protein
VLSLSQGFLLREGVPGSALEGAQVGLQASRDINRYTSENFPSQQYCTMTTILALYNKMVTINNDKKQ